MKSMYYLILELFEDKKTHDSEKENVLSYTICIFLYRKGLEKP